MTDPLEATRTSYDAVASLYAELFGDVLDTRPLDRAVLAAFAEVCRSAGHPVADLGCGPGHLTAHLASLGLDVFGLDLSPAMIALARQAHPDLRFDEGTMTALDLADGALGGILASYSVIHTPPSEVPAVFAEFHRVLAPGGHLLLGFFAGDDAGPRAFDHRVTTAYRWSPGGLAEVLGEAGFTEVGRMVRPPIEGERFLQAQLLVRKAQAPTVPGAVTSAARYSTHASQIQAAR
ncbi:class I SAM-dependent DNA methyltransferase [Lentzea jiangxiensis]|uniref:Ubiquinone/menaquinone biosynthesis C-methylase UbiE n=1 Tax=Lentzea jiangxiensis TaxID=641025 RepID=A0A1H0L557_9PSEU|nr:class I SAM-dependent methyltransferase [Lentzea jiangxiensis]SDO63166.1 Ubiquinone/menaquinone biosynthesis C-methylase UbiE [Lentzea jiangxiensis]